MIQDSTISGPDQNNDFHLPHEPGSGLLRRGPTRAGQNDVFLQLFWELHCRLQTSVGDLDWNFDLKASSLLVKLLLKILPRRCNQFPQCV